MLYLYLYLQLFILYTRMTCDFYLYICYRSTVYRRAVYVYNLLLAISLVLCIKYISILVLLCVYKLLLTDCDCLSTVLHCALPVHCTYVCRLLRGLPLLFLSLCQCTQHRAPYSRTVYIRSYTGFAVATAAAAGISSGTQIKYTTLAHWLWLWLGCCGLCCQTRARQPHNPRKPRASCSHTHDTHPVNT